MEKQINWINDLLKNAENESGPQIIKVIEGCGYGCAVQSGHIEGMQPLKTAAAACKTHVGRGVRHESGCRDCGKLPAGWKRLCH